MAIEVGTGKAGEVNSVLEAFARGRREPVYFCDFFMGRKLHDGQAEFIVNAEAKVNCLATANRWGKTTELTGLPRGSSRRPPEETVQPAPVSKSIATIDLATRSVTRTVPGVKRQAPTAPAEANSAPIARDAARTKPPARPSARMINPPRRSTDVPEQGAYHACGAIDGPGKAPTGAAIPVGGKGIPGSVMRWAAPPSPESRRSCSW